MSTPDPNQPPARTATTTAPTPANPQQTPQTQQEAAQQNPDLPQVNYFLYNAADQTPVGILRQVNDQTGMRIDKVDTNGDWQPSNDAIQDLYPIGDQDNETSLWSYTNATDETTAKQVYDQHFAAGSQTPEKPPTTTVQSPPASGTTAPPTNIGTPAKFYDGIAVKTVTGEVHVGPYVRRGHIVGGYVAHRRVVNLPGLGDVVDDVSAPGEPISDRSLQIIKKYGLDKPYLEIPKSKRTQELIDGAGTTQALYQVNGEYTPARQALHQKILDGLFAGHKPVPEGERTALFSAGGTASGKSSALEVDDSLLPPDAVTINPDDFKEQLPEWDKLTEIPPAIDAAAVLHDESSDIAKMALDRAIREGYNIVLDGTGDGTPGKFLRKVQSVHDAGYTTNVLMVDVPTNIAIDRMIARGKKARRYIPIPDMYENHHGAIERMLEWSTDPMIHRFSVYRTTQRPPTIVATGGGGRRLIHNRAEWDAMIAKTKELQPGAEDQVGRLLSDYRIPDTDANRATIRNLLARDTEAATRARLSGIHGTPEAIAAGRGKQDVIRPRGRNH